MRSAINHAVRYQKYVIFSQTDNKSKPFKIMNDSVIINQQITLKYVCISLPINTTFIHLICMKYSSNENLYLP